MMISNQTMDYSYLEGMRKHPAWKLLNAESAPLIISFLDQVFIQTNARALSQSVLTAKLDDMLYTLNQQIGNRYPRPAQEYLDEWAKGENAYLRKYYPEKGEEPEFDLTSATEKAIEWLRSLEQKSFVGTESRLLHIFQMLREVIQATELDPAVRIAALEKRKDDIEKEILALRNGNLVSYDSTKVKERFFQIEEAARRLLADFRQVEDNFRKLDRDAREIIAISNKKKGELLDDIFGAENAIEDSDEGRSFRAFWEFLMSPSRHDELQDLVQKLLKLEEVDSLTSDTLLTDFKYRLMQSGDKVKRTSASLAEHLRKFLEGQTWLENRRIMEIIRSIEKQAIEMRQTPPKDSKFSELNDVKPGLELTMARGLFDPTKYRKILLNDMQITEGDADFGNDALYDIHFVDESELVQRLDDILAEQSQVTLVEVCFRFPLEKGLSELLAYLNIATKNEKSVIDDTIHEIISWHDAHGNEKTVHISRVIFKRELTYV